MKTETEIENEVKAKLFIVIVFLFFFFIALLLNTFINSNINKYECEMINFKNNIVEMTCKDDLKIIKKFNDLKHEEWDQFKEKFNCQYTGHEGEFKCDNNIQVKRSDIFLSEWYTFRNENHCRLVEIDKTVRENQNHWSCDNNINISNDFYK